MQLQRQGQLGIEIVATPFPSGLADQRGQMIHWKPISLAEGFVTEPEGDLARRMHLIAREQQIQIVLRAKARIGHEGGSVSEPLERNELESSSCECAMHFLISELGAPPAFRVVRQVLDRNAPATQAGKRSRQRSANGIANCVRWQKSTSWSH